VSRQRAGSALALGLALTGCASAPAAPPGDFAGSWTGWIDVVGGDLSQVGGTSGGVRLTLTLTPPHEVHGTVSAPGVRGVVRGIVSGTTAYGVVEGLGGQGSGSLTFEATLEGDTLRARVEFSHAVLRRAGPPAR
jgi:hypothetical protein